MNLWSSMLTEPSLKIWLNGKVILAYILLNYAFIVWSRVECINARALVYFVSHLLEHFYTPRLWRVGCNSFDIIGKDAHTVYTNTRSCPPASKNVYFCAPLPANFRDFKLKNVKKAKNCHYNAKNTRIWRLVCHYFRPIMSSWTWAWSQPGQSQELLTQVLYAFWVHGWPGARNETLAYLSGALRGVIIGQIRVPLNLDYGRPWSVCVWVTTLKTERTDVQTWILAWRSSGRISRSSS